MNKYLIVAIVVFSLMVTTVYALNDNGNYVNEPSIYNQNCPYHDVNDSCPYYNEKIDTYNCPNNGNCQHNNGGNGNHYGRQGGCPHHNR